MKKVNMLVSMGMNKTIPQYWLVNQGFTMEDIDQFLKKGILKLVKDDGKFTKYDNRLIH